MAEARAPALKKQEPSQSEVRRIVLHANCWSLRLCYSSFRVIRRFFCWGSASSLAIGIFLRLPPSLFEVPGAPLHAFAALHPTPGFTGVGFDENLYRSYVNGVIQAGLLELSRHRRPLHRGSKDARRLHSAADAFPLHLLRLCLASDFRDRGSCGPAQRSVALQHSLPASCHGVCLAFKGPRVRAWLWRRWWPSRRRSSICPNTHLWTASLLSGRFSLSGCCGKACANRANWRWLLPYLFGLSLMVITKENAAFVYFAILVLIAANHWLKWGTVTRELLACTLIGPLLGFVILVFLAGGLETLRITYQLSVSKNYQLTYAIMTGDGPWHRYLVDLVLGQPNSLAPRYRSSLQARPNTKAGAFPEPFYRRKLFGHVQYQIRDEPALRQHVGHASARAGVQPNRSLVRFVRALSRRCLITISVAAICAFEFEAISHPLCPVSALRTGHGGSPPGVAHPEIALRRFCQATRARTSARNSALPETVSFRRCRGCGSARARTQIW